MTFRIITGDCIEHMQGMDENSVDAIVTDPPYGLRFMGKAWDKFDSDEATEARARAGNHQTPGDPKAAHPTTPRSQGAREAGTYDLRLSGQQGFQREAYSWGVAMLRVLKPGSHLLIFGGTRTYHRLTCALEDAGFEIRDCLAWLYGSGFPKSLDVSKAIDKAAGAEREADDYTGANGLNHVYGDGMGGGVTIRKGKAATPDAQRWQGWGTALKPAFEPVVLARKPLSERNVASNVLRWGVGALNIDGCRIGTDDAWEASGVRSAPSVAFAGGADGSLNVSVSSTHPSGRWPANLILDETAAAMLDEQTGESSAKASRVGTKGGNGGALGAFAGSTADALGRWPADPGGGASRFFYVPKADREERNRGTATYGEVGMSESPGQWGSIQEWSANPKARNHHPTVKPVELMQWLCRMVTPPKGLVLDPFLGSGSTGMAALREGFEFIGIEREPDYVEIARARIIGDAPLFNVEEMA